MTLTFSTEQLKAAVADYANKLPYINHDKVFVKPEHVNILTHQDYDENITHFDGVSIDLEAARKEG